MEKREPRVAEFVLTPNRGLVEIVNVIQGLVYLKDSPHYPVQISDLISPRDDRPDVWVIQHDTP
jgi:hypothetical protein